MKKFLIIVIVAGICPATIFANSPADSLTIQEGRKKCILSPDIYQGQEVYSLAKYSVNFSLDTREFIQFISKNINLYNTHDINASKIYLTFIVDTLGYLKEPCVINSPLGNGINYAEKEIISVLKHAPKFKPAAINNLGVCVRVFIPIIICMR